MGISTQDFERMRARMLTGTKSLRPNDSRTSKAVERENDLHDQIFEYCKLKDYLVIHSRTDRATTNEVGTPDFVIMRPYGVTILLECKAKGNKATTAQLAKLAHAKKLGFVAEIVDNFDDAIRFIEG